MYYNNYMANRWQPQQQVGMSQNMQMQQMQQQMMQQQFPQIAQQQYAGLKGRVVSSLEEVKAIPVDMDGTETYFPHPASNSIYTKAIDMNGNPVIHRYVLDNTGEKETTVADLDKRVKSLEELLDSLTGGTK